ncbi:MAG: hypothetical protein AAFN81_01785 [Bacteroidota bacterium]
MFISSIALNRACTFVLLVFSFVLYTSCGSDQAAGASSETAVEEAKPEKPLGYLIERYLEAYPDELTAITDASRVPEIAAAMKAYNAGRYEEAIELFPNYAQSKEQAGYVHLYRGISQLMADKEYDAFRTFQLINSSMGKSMEISNWYLTLNYVGFNNVFEARRKLETIITAGAYPGETAQQLLDDLPEN